MTRTLRTASDLLHGLQAVASGHRMTGLPKQDVAVPTRTQREPAASWKTQSSDGSARALLSLDTGETLVFSLGIGLWPGHAGPIGIDVIAV
ncbi:hypothetical protein D8Y22_17160 [Salinadaptatus halalkaliphilus]|uniref:Uncharacterized protein n=1 Tax=Salinadaptatus halalkaliphilus TaxID=2419781 RepID=A0A4S3TI12_9EURY|nr:hypothetical protein D8Y22_17160 [Salinadaptatus halalkaliphilus]